MRDNEYEIVEVQVTKYIVVNNEGHRVSGFHCTHKAARQEFRRRFSDREFGDDATLVDI